MPDEPFAIAADRGVQEAEDHRMGEAETLTWRYDRTRGLHQPQPATAASQSPYKGDERVIAACTLGLWGSALIAFFVQPLLTLVLVIAWGMGLMVGLHVQAIREARCRREHDHGADD